MWLWTDTLAEILVACDRVPPARVAGWIERPVAHRVADDREALEVARALLDQDPPGASSDAARPA